jgi:hypothetical protein
MGRGNSLLVAFRENQTKGNLEFPAGRKTLKNLLFQSGLFAEGLFFWGCGRHANNHGRLIVKALWLGITSHGENKRHA